ncbi:MAG TPA: phage tail sheath C-terminal domain-containing protein, partial [Accumulibacter sp.]|nr:phage tail sheath C-terminal domain-containing protein [Accumulibacter sp.]
WTHLSVRRLIDWLQAQLAADLAWAPFEPNNAALWSAMAATARRRLRHVFDAGALAGNSEADSYFVRCDATTSTPTDLDAGRAVMLIGVAPAVPAEFIVFRLLRHGADDPRLEIV